MFESVTAGDAAVFPVGIGNTVDIWGIANCIFSEQKKKEKALKYMP